MCDADLMANTPDPQPLCDGRCIFASDLGLPYNAIATRDPACSVHGMAALVAEVERLRAEVTVLEDKLEYAEYGDDL